MPAKPMAIAATRCWEYNHKMAMTSAQFLENRRQHHQAKAAGIAGDHQKGNLPGQRDAREAVEVFGMRDGRRKITGDLRFGKIQRRDCENAVNAGDEKKPIWQISWRHVPIFGISKRGSAASICARCGSSQGGRINCSPKRSMFSSRSKPGPSVANSNSTPPGSRK